MSDCLLLSEKNEAKTFNYDVEFNVEKMNILVKFDKLCSKANMYAGDERVVCGICVYQQRHQPAVILANLLLGYVSLGTR